MTDNRPTFKVEGTADLLAAIPSALGHTPENEVLILLMEEQKMAATLAAPVQGLMYPEKMTGALENLPDDIHPSGVMVVLYCDFMPLDIARMAVSVIHGALSEKGLEVDEAWLVDDTEWQVLSHDCKHDTCRGKVADLANTQTALDIVAAGIVLNP